MYASSDAGNVTVIQQPGCQTQDTDNPQWSISIPRELHYLSMVDQLIVRQHREWLEIFTGFETENKYTVYDANGRKLYYAAEKSDVCSRIWWGGLRDFEMTIMDDTGKEVIHLTRPLACGACCCPCCLQSIAVMAPSGLLYGSIRQELSCWNPKFVILNANGEPVLRIKGPAIRCCEPSFYINTIDGEHTVGKIKKRWAGLLQEMFTDADNFAISFPLDLNVEIKAVLLGALFLIDYMYFETNNN